MTLTGEVGTPGLASADVGLGATALVAVSLVVAAWASFWAALASTVGMSRGATARFGLFWGFVLGPFALGVVYARTRGGGVGMKTRTGAARQVAGRYGEKARRSYDAWRDDGTAPSMGASRVLADATWVLPPAAPAPSQDPIKRPSQHPVSPTDPTVVEPGAGPSRTF